MKYECCGYKLIKDKNLVKEFEKFYHDHGYCSTRVYVCPICHRAYAISYEEDMNGDHFSNMRLYPYEF